MLGWSAQELIGKPIHDVAHHLRPDGTPFPSSECAELAVLTSGQGVVDQPDHFIRSDGRSFPIRYTASPVLTGGQIRGLVVMFRDTTEAVELAKERERLLMVTEHARAAAEAANRAKDEFLSVVTHELRTPLASIMNWVGVLSGGDGRHLERALQSIQRSVEAQAKLVEDLLDVSRITTGRLRLDMRAVNLGRVARSALETVLPTAEAKGIRLVAKVEDSFPGVLVLGDPERLQQVVWNLLSNAVKFTPAEGRVELALDRGEKGVRLTVSDTGQGISPEFLPYVFERFQQAEPAGARRQGGLGLGLAIVRHIVEAHGGHVSAESPGPQRGATFTVWLPLLDAA
jgi:PAS domain S-box-containing protein